ncbi:MAG: MBL fold metallo-hydrolase [Armatimonadota bacterium]
MELTIFGTAAAEAWPAPFCRCAPCQEARRRGGPNIRSRSGALLDNDLKIDFSADTVSHMLRTGRDLADVRTLVFTHQHNDHIVPTELAWAAPPFTNTPPQQPIQVFGNATVVEMLTESTSHIKSDYFQVQPAMTPLTPITTPTGDTLLPLPADHAPGSLVLRITRGDRTLFYGHDSGLYPEETLAALADGPTLDIALFDCTNGGQKTRNRGHMGVDGVAQMAYELRRRGAVTDRTKLIATHFSHNGGLLHEELVEAFLPHGIAVAFDGMVVRA